MTIYIFHGDDIGKSRKSLNDLLDQAKAKGAQISFFEGAKINLPDLETALSSTNLFYDEVVVIEGLLSRLRNKLKDSLIKLVTDFKGKKDIVLWDSKEVTKPNLTPFGKNAKIYAFKTPAIIFQLLETLKPGNGKLVHQIMTQSSDSLDSGFIFIMVARHISNLIVAKSGDASKLPPFTRSRLLSQAFAWDESLLLKLHEQILKIDRNLKTGATKLDYFSQLDILLVSSLR